MKKNQLKRIFKEGRSKLRFELLFEFYADFITIEIEKGRIHSQIYELIRIDLNLSREQLKYNSFYVASKKNDLFTKYISPKKANQQLINNKSLINRWLVTINKKVTDYSF